MLLAHWTCNPAKMASMRPFGHRHSMELPGDAVSAHTSLAAAADAPEHCPNALAARLAASQAGMNVRLAHQIAIETTRHARPVRLFSLLLIPEHVWRGRHGKFLLHTLALNPYDPWNVLISPADAESAALVETPPPPAQDCPETLERCAELLAAARQRYADALDLTDWSNEFVSVEAARVACREEVHALAMALRDALLHVVEPPAPPAESD